jgi:hypothetical protein
MDQREDAASPTLRSREPSQSGLLHWLESWLRRNELRRV